MRFIIKVVATMREYEVEVDDEMSILCFIEYMKQLNKPYDVCMDNLYHHHYQLLDLKKQIKDYPELAYDILWIY